MRPRWTNLSESDQATFRAATAFLGGRLEERATVWWALRLRPGDTVKRQALLGVIDSAAGRKIREPWRSAWRLIEESWDAPPVEEHTSTGVYSVQHRLRSGERSRSLVAAIVSLVASRLRVEPFSDSHGHFREPPRRPKRVEDLLTTRLTSGRIVDPALLGLENLTDGAFLLSLCLALESAVANGLETARRIGWDGGRLLWRTGQLYRVYYVSADERGEGLHEPDESHRGIAPSAKLLHAAVSRLVDIDVSSAVQLVRRWKLTNSPVYLRLWAALSRDSRVTSSNEIGAWLLSLDDRHFWKLHEFPEIAELRARRFNDLSAHEQTALIARIRRRPPRNQWPKGIEAERLKRARLYWAVRELRRIEIAGAPLPKRSKSWLDKEILEFQDLSQMTRADEGFPDSPSASLVPARPDSKYGSLAGEERLSTLETSLSLARRGWDDDSSEGAADWIKQPGNQGRILADLESVPDGGSSFAQVWSQFGWVHSPGTGTAEDGGEYDSSAEGVRVLSLLDRLPDATFRKAVDGISHWFYAWRRRVVNRPEGLSVWLKLWPIAVEATNAEQRVGEEIHLKRVVQSSDDSEPIDFDTLNTPAGKLVGVFLDACPGVQGGDCPFGSESSPRRMRDAISAASGRSGLIALHRMIEALPYFLAADPDWTQEHLVGPLMADNPEAMVLWRAVARQTRFSGVLTIIGGPMAERATDQRLSRETRSSFVFSLVIECLHAFREQREPAVPCTRIQQMIRSLDDEVRAYGAAAIQRFVLDVSASNEGGDAASSPEQVFRSAAAPFLELVWPQERSLSTPGVSRALADLPATARGEFANAVDAIACFLVPFECWSMVDYGFGGEDDDKPNLSIINNCEKAAGLLRLLDLTIGTSEGSVIPHDLADALNQVRRVAPRVADSRIFRRLATAARRG